MLAKVLVSSALFTSSLALIISPSASAVDPTITPGPQFELFRKQNNARYMGWVAQRGNWTSRDCEAGATYFQSGGHWRCCGTTSAGCDIPQACANGNLIFNGRPYGSTTSITMPCSEAYPDPTDSTFTICNTAFMYENEQDSSPMTNVNCGISSLNWSYYRVQPEAAKTTATPTTPRQGITTTTPGANDETAPADPTVVPANGEKSSSKAWIAGAVVGPIVGLALIGFLAWFCLRKKKKSKAATAPQAGTYNPQPQPAGPTSPTSPPQYYPPPMQQQQGAGMVPFGVADGKQNTWSPQPQSPTSQASSPNPLSMYGTQYPQQGGHAGPTQPVYNAPSPSMSPPPLSLPPQQGAYAETNANFHHAPHEARPFSSELDANPQLISVQPKQH